MVAAILGFDWPEFEDGVAVSASADATFFSSELSNYYAFLLSGQFWCALFSCGIIFKRFFGFADKFVRIYAFEQEDGVLLTLQTGGVSPSAFFCAKWLHSYLYAFFILIPVLGLNALFFQGIPNSLLNVWLELLGALFLAMAGLVSLGVLLSFLTLKINGREILFPVLYFPLTIPVILAATQGSLLLLDRQDGASWFLLLFGFDIIYLVLAFAFFDELWIGNK